MNGHGMKVWHLAAVAAAVALMGGPASMAATDCNANGVDDLVDIANATSDDCNLNGVPDECEGDFDGDSVIDGCDDCGQQLSSDDDQDGWGRRQNSTSRGRLIWISDSDDVYFHDGTATSLFQAGDINDPALNDVADFVFHLGGGDNPGEVIGLWRRGTDFAWVFVSDGGPPQLINAENPYDASQAVNPEAAAIADGCAFVTLQSFDPDSPLAVGIKHVYQVDPFSGDATLLTGDFLDDGNTAGTGASPIGFVTSGCSAAWQWCGELDNNFDCQRDELHYFDGTEVQVLDTNARPMSFEQGRLIYLKDVGGVTQVFLFDANLQNPSIEQLTQFTVVESRVVRVVSDGRHVVILRGDVNGLNRELMTLGGFPLTDGNARPADVPSAAVPLQIDRGLLCWEAEGETFFVFDGAVLQTVCGEGWLRDGSFVVSRNSDDTGADTEVYLKSIGEPADPSRPYAPWFVTAEATANGEATLNWEPILGATSYHVYYASEAGVTQENFADLAGGQMQSVDGDANQTTIAGLSADSTWHFVVSAVDASGESPDSRGASVVPCADDTLDADEDGTPDCEDACPLDAAKTAPGACGCGHPDEDANGNGIADCNDDESGGNANGNDNGSAGGNDNSDGSQNNGSGDSAAVNACGDDGACGGASAMPLAALMVSMQAARRRKRIQRQQA